MTMISPFLKSSKLYILTSRELYKFMQETLRDSNTNSKGGKSSSKQGKGADSFSYEQVKQAQDEYNEEATLFVFRLKSLKQGQFRSLLTQATRHHAAQVSCSNLLSHVSVLYACVFWLWLYIMFLFVCKCCLPL